jgi:hypothetical protein
MVLVEMTGQTTRVIQMTASDRKELRVSADDILPWLSESLADVIVLPIEGEQRTEASRALISTFNDRVSILPPDEQSHLIAVLDRWIRSGQIEGYSIPTDKETYAWMEALVGTMLGILET